MKKSQIEKIIEILTAEYTRYIKDRDEYMAEETKFHINFWNDLLKESEGCVHKWKFAYAETYSNGEIRNDMYILCEKCGKMKRQEVNDIRKQNV